MPRIDDSSEEVKVWLDYPEEVNRLAEQAAEDGWERRISVLLMGKCGLRASGIPTATPAGLEWNNKGEYWQLEVRGKDTSGGGKKTRYTVVPEDLKRELDNFQRERNIAPRDPYIDSSVSTIRRWVYEAAEELEANEWQHVSSHDLRRSWATHLLVENDVDARVAMSLGGWSSYEALEPYLTKPTPSKIGDEIKSVEL